MTMTRGILLGVEATVSEDYDIGYRQGYMVKKSLTIEGITTEDIIGNGIWDSIKDVGDLPIWVSATRTFSGHEWPWSKEISKFDVEYQAVHMIKDSILVTVAAVVLYALPYVAGILLVLLAWKVVTYMILKLEAVAQWIADNAPQVATGIGAGMVLVAALILLGGDKK